MKAWIEGFGTSRWTVPALFALAIGLRLVVMLLLPVAPMSDAEWYVVRAGEMARGLGYQEGGYPTAFWPVGYPALLAGSMAVFGPGLTGPMIVNLAAAAATLALILWFARRLGGGEPAARIAGLLYALYPAHIAYAASTDSETASTAVAMLAFALLIAGWRRWPLLVAAGLVFGAATLMRAQMMLFPIGAIAAVAIALRDGDRRRIATALIAVHLAMAAVLLPWSLRNEAVLGAFVPVSTNGGVALLTGANDAANGDFIEWEHGPLWERSGIPYDQRVAKQVELDRRFKAMARQWIAAHPTRWTALGFVKMALVWRKDSDAFWTFDASYPGRERLWLIVQVADQLYYLGLLALGIAGLWMAVRAWWRRDAGHAPLILLGCMPAFATLTAFGFTGQTRYHYPAMPFLIVAAGWTLALLARRWTGAVRRPPAVIAA